MVSDANVKKGYRGCCLFMIPDHWHHGVPSNIDELSVTDIKPESSVIGTGWIYSKLHTSQNPEDYKDRPFATIQTNCQLVTKGVKECKYYIKSSDE